MVNQIQNPNSEVHLGLLLNYCHKILLCFDIFSLNPILKGSENEMKFIYLNMLSILGYNFTKFIIQFNNIVSYKKKLLVEYYNS